MTSLITAFGALALVGGSVGYLFFPMGLAAGVNMAVNLAKDGMVYPIYMDPPFATQSEIHLFAITNPREVLRGGKMSLQVKGPYKFDTYLKRDNIVFTQQGDRVRYDSGRKLFLNETESANLDEKMWLINPILPSVHKTVRSMILDRLPFKRISEPIVFNVVSTLLDNFKERLILRSTAREYLFGRKVLLLDSLTSVAERFGLGSLVPPGPPQNIFGLASIQNKTTNRLEMWTGVGGSRDKFAEVVKWRDMRQMDIWRGKCNTIEGTNGEIFKPLLEQGKPMRIFFSLLCRSLELEPVGDGEPVMLPELGMQVLDYEFSRRTYWGTRKNPDNKCYCDDVRSPDCQYDGLISVAPCFFGSPIYMSRGNYTGVDERIRQTVDSTFLNGSPSVQMDWQRFSVEPITGTVLRANLTLMAFVKMVKQPFMRDLAQVQNLTYAPLFTTTERVQVPYKYVWHVHLLQMLNNYYKPITVGTATGGIAMLLMKFFFF